jgi:2-C-methyl-D-erythritol 4-phosphate cytidylyltransferase
VSCFDGISTVAVLLAAGSGSRVGAGINKVLLPLGNGTVLDHILNTFALSKLFRHIFIVSSVCDIDTIKEIASSHNSFKQEREISVVEGGSTRQESVAAALATISEQLRSNGSALGNPGTFPELIVIHDAARCFVSTKLLENCISAARTFAAVSAALPVVDSLVSVVDKAASIVDRDGLWAIQTPQVFRYDLVVKAHTQAIAQGITATDDAALVRRLHPVELVPGERGNFKITTADDYAFAQIFAQQTANNS